MDASDTDRLALKEHDVEALAHCAGRQKTIVDCASQCGVAWRRGYCCNVSHTVIQIEDAPRLILAPLQALAQFDLAVDHPRSHATGSFSRSKDTHQ